MDLIYESTTRVESDKSFGPLVTSDSLDSFYCMSRKLSGTIFIISQISLLALGLVFIGWLYFFLQGHSGDKNKVADNKPVTSEPTTLTLEMTAPEDNMLSFKNEVLVTGQTQKNLKILISSEDHDMVVDSDSAGNFSADFPLEEGVNDINIAVFEPTGDSRTAEKFVYYSKEQI